MSERDLVTMLYVLASILLALSLGLVVWSATRLIGLPLFAVAMSLLVVAGETRKKMKNG